MISEELARKIVGEYQEAYFNFMVNNSKQNKVILSKKENVCIDKLSYIVKMRVSKYKKFNNYDDLYQEGLLMLLHSMKTYDPKKGSFFWWSNKYIGTKISRVANQHTTIRIPLKEAKKVMPYKEVVLPALFEEQDGPEINYEEKQLDRIIESSLNCLDANQRNVITLLFGINCDSENPIHKICKKLNISRNECIKLINHAMVRMKSNILNLNNNFFDC